MKSENKSFAPAGVSVQVDELIKEAYHISARLLGFETTSDWIRHSLESNLHPDALKLAKSALLARDALQKEQSAQRLVA